MKRILSVLIALTMLTAAFSACGRVENPYNDADENGSESTASSRVTSSESQTTLSPAEISKRSEQSSKDAIAKAKSEASSRAAEKAGGSIGDTYTAEIKTSAKKTDKTVSTSKSLYESTIDYVKVPDFLKSSFKRAWVVKRFEGLDMRIVRLEYGLVKQSFDKSVSSQIVNPKTFTYTPACTIAVITTDSPTRLGVSKGTQKNSTEQNAENAGAVIAVDGTKGTYKQEYTATIRSGAVYRSFTGSAARRTQLVMYKDGHWEFKALDNAAAAQAVKNGALNSVGIQDITIQNGKITVGYADSPYRNHTFIGQINANKYVFMVTEFMPIRDAAGIMLAYGVNNAVQICGGNCSYMYLKGVGNTTGSAGASIKGLNKLGKLETEWLADRGMLAKGKSGGPCYDELDCIYFK